MKAAPSRFRSIREAIEASVLSPEQIERIREVWPNVLYPRWRRDVKVGFVERSYTIANSEPGAGQSGSAVVATIEPDGKRLMTRWGDIPARINTYGDSFTHCDQVNDRETWQEYLAAHLLEPIRNFGRGGGSVYETYLRMLSEETTDNSGEYLLFYMWGDDHMRSILGGNMSVSLLSTAGSEHWQSMGYATPYLRVDPQTGAVSEHPNFLPDAESVAHLGSPEWLRQQYEQDLVAQLMLFGGHPAYGDTDRGGVIGSIDEDEMSTLAATLDFAEGWETATDRAVAARELLDRYSLRASIYVIEKARAFAREHGKKIMFLLLDPFRSVKTMIESGVRYDEAIVDHLAATGTAYFDMTQVHVNDFHSRRDDWPGYLRHHFVDGGGHYNPAGNHFFAFSLLPYLIDFLDPKPTTYIGAGNPDADEYLFNGRFGAAVER